MNCSEKIMDVSGYQIRPTKHFMAGWMRRWRYTIDDLYLAFENAYKVEKVGKRKYEVYFREKGKSRKLICTKNEKYKDSIIITGAEGT